jgi:hypothetical protein
MYITLHLDVVKDFWKFKILKDFLNFLKISNSQLFNFECFWVWIASYYHLNFFLIKFFY